MKQEPVAYEGIICWYGEKPNGALIYAESKYEKYILEDKGFEMKPLYTAPKELSDEEIWEELRLVKHTWITTTETWYEFEKKELTKAVRAILKKASEK